MITHNSISKCNLLLKKYKRIPTQNRNKIHDKNDIILLNLGKYLKIRVPPAIQIRKSFFLANFIVLLNYHFL